MRTKISFIHIVIIGFWPGRALLQNLGNSHGAGKRTGSVKGIILGDVNNDSVLSQEHNQSGIVVSGIPSPGG